MEKAVKPGEVLVNICGALVPESRVQFVRKVLIPAYLAEVLAEQREKEETKS